MNGGKEEGVEGKGERRKEGGCLRRVSGGFEVVSGKVA